MKEKPAPAEPARVPKIHNITSGRAGLADSAFKSVRRLGVLEIFERLLCRCNQRTECFGLMNCNVGQNLAVNLNTSLGQTIDETAIGQALLTDSRIDALDPQSAERALAILAVAIGILL